MKKRILFVDDEPNILEGLQRMLRDMRQEWDMHFAKSGQEALDCLSREPFDVVISDMRMPGMDGAQLLTEVMRRHPQIVRIILSGHSDQDIILKAVRPAHQYLSKPCDPETLKSVVRRACAVRDLLADASIKRMISTMESLPTLPSLYVEIMEELRSPNASIQKTGKIISKDVGMTAKVLQLVNSAFFGLPRHVSSPGQAVALIGLDTVKALVLSVHIFTQFAPKELTSLEGLWKHSLTTSLFAKIIAREENQKQTFIDDCFMTGLLHDLGKLILSVNLPDRYRQIHAGAIERNISLWDAEREVLGVTHSEVGAYLLGLWGLPDDTVEGLAFHHCPNACQRSNFSLLTAVHSANALAHEECAEKSMEVLPHIDVDYLSKLGIANRLPRWKEVCSKALKEGAIND